MDKPLKVYGPNVDALFASLGITPIGEACLEHMITTHTETGMEVDVVLAKGQDRSFCALTYPDGRSVVVTADPMTVTTITSQSGTDTAFVKKKEITSVTITTKEDPLVKAAMDHKKLALAIIVESGTQARKFRPE